MIKDPRHIALKVLLDWHKGSWTLDQSLENYSNEISGLQKNDRSLCNAIIFGVLRKKEAIDWIIRSFSNTAIQKIDIISLYILRIALFQILHMDRIPAFAAIHNAVNISKALSGSKTAGFINAVLRKASDKHPALSLPDKKTEPDKFLSVKYSLPPWLSKRWIQAFGIEQTERLCLQIDAIPHITICCNILKTNPQALSEQLYICAKNIQLTEYAAQGIFFSNPLLPVYEFEAFRLGFFHVQDEAAQIVTEYFGPEPGETVLDACAGFGGKTFHIAQLMQNKGVMIASDSEPGKLEKLRLDANRLGIDIIQTKTIDILKSTIKDFDFYFDRVLIDAPCTGLGVLQRNPDTKWKRSKKDIERLSAKQKKMINAAANLVKPGGILVYAVCSCEREENEDVIHAFLDKRKDFSIDKVLYFAKYSLFITHEGFLKTYPDPKNMDGFFAARLIRKSKIN
ncbi:MAG: 16S rRNA (cytosine(967)-C(5))-methyltransferase [Desulfobacula sp. RIFOXYB2_FULL_45_6]|nr:MAG: 16S rRNA (cytosine(967)-C(5))-methyltransferase [Desulfobacula sp. RIFOXYB2_FULL_45_6]